MFCKSCKNPLPKKAEQAGYCVYCGKPISKSLAWVRWTAGVIVLGIGLGVIAYFLLLRSGGTGQPDLVIQDVSWSPSEPTAGEEVVFNVTIKNRGGGGSDSSTVSFYVDGSPKKSERTDSVGGGRTTTLTFTWVAQRGSPKIRVVADPDNAITEIDETNNGTEVVLGEIAVVVQFHLTGPDGYDWYAVCKGEAVTRHEGTAANHSITVTASAEDWEAILGDQWSVFSAWSSGRLTVDGDMMLLMELSSSILELL
ncbi:MAG: SCP2 sterol-binding domain-containing protein [Dehalococcoidia bacterium]|nr:SCP2 sterol-binding domain-containing protein [Dehalococcoidia bacterium]